MRLSIWQRAAANGGCAEGLSAAVDGSGLLLRLARHGSMLHTVPAGTILFKQGDSPNFQVVVISGSVQLFGRSTGGPEVLVKVVSPPDLIIPAAVVSGAPYLMRARVPEPSTFLLIQARTFRDLVASDLTLANSVISSLSTQSRRMVRQIKNLKLRSAVQRIGCYLLTLSERQAPPRRPCFLLRRTSSPRNSASPAIPFRAALRALRGMASASTVRPSGSTTQRGWRRSVFPTRRSMITSSGLGGWTSRHIQHNVL